MALTEDKKKQYIRKLLLSRMRILNSNGFYGLLLMHMLFAVDENVSTACTDGTTITFGTAFLDELSEKELDFVMMHEILHVALRHVSREENRDHEAFNIACDIVVNSNILKSNSMNMSSITLRNYGESMHLTPKGKEGYEYTAEEVYEMVIKDAKRRKKNGSKAVKGNDNSYGEKDSSEKQNQNNSDETEDNANFGWDDHSKWKNKPLSQRDEEEWTKRCIDAAKAAEFRDPSNSRGTIPACAERILKELMTPQIDWRIILNEFVQEELVDYSLSPPDKRFTDSPFFLPAFNVLSESAENILFMIDTSASMSDKMVTAAYSEIKGAIDQFDGKLRGYLGFFDAAVIPPVPFEDENEFRIIRPKGGGGTDFNAVFSYIKKNMSDKLPVSIIILTDGYAPFPDKKAAMDIPVLWIINNENVTPPWGKIARIKI